jgi:hypothetical protein
LGILASLLILFKLKAASFRNDLSKSKYKIGISKVLAKSVPTSITFFLALKMGLVLLRYFAIQSYSLWFHILVFHVNNTFFTFNLKSIVPDDAVVISLIKLKLNQTNLP